MGDGKPITVNLEISRLAANRSVLSPEEVGCRCVHTMSGTAEPSELPRQRHTVLSWDTSGPWSRDKVAFGMIPQVKPPRNSRPKLLPHEVPRNKVPPDETRLAAAPGCFTSSGLARGCCGHDSLKVESKWTFQTLRSGTPSPCPR